MHPDIPSRPIAGPAIALAMRRVPIPDRGPSPWDAWRRNTTASMPDAMLNVFVEQVGLTTGDGQDRRTCSTRPLGLMLRSRMRP